MLENKHTHFSKIISIVYHARKTSKLIKIKTQQRGLLEDY